MIYEIRTYGVKVGSVAEVEKRYGEAYESRKKYSPLTAFFHTEVGPLNEIIHIWGYKDLAERARIRAEAAKDANWPPKIQEFIVRMQSEIVVPFPFTTELLPGKIGPIFEMRYYTIRAGTLPDIIKRWAGAIDARTKLSPLALAGHVEFGEANRYYHVWAYQSMEHRAAIRNEARQKGIWPPPGGGDMIVTQMNKICMPSSFSPVQ
jgi:hypothetical protein